MRAPRNTATADPALHLLGFMGYHRGSDYITDMEAQGQRELVTSDVLPTRCDETALAAIGVRLGAGVPGDGLFRYAQLPAGWSRQGSDHAMWSYIVDEHARRRISIFYKAAFYDRSAHCTVETVASYVYAVANNQSPLVFDDWAKASAVRDIALERAAHADEQAKEYDRPGREDWARDERQQAAAYRRIAEQALTATPS